jgi:hypothetical protein
MDKVHKPSDSVRRNELIYRLSTHAPSHFKSLMGVDKISSFYYHLTLVFETEVHVFLASLLSIRSALFLLSLYSLLTVLHGMTE